jgi:hypothetical protein
MQSPRVPHCHHPLRPEYLPQHPILEHLDTDQVSEPSRVKNKSKFRPGTRHEGTEGEQRHSSILSLTSALDRVGGQRHAPAALSSGKKPGTH